jgi:hypothetical protein
MNWKKMQAITEVPEHAVDIWDGLLHDLGDTVVGKSSHLSDWRLHVRTRSKEL